MLVVIEILILIVAFIGITIYGSLPYPFKSFSHSIIAIVFGGLPFIGISCLVSGFIEAFLPLNYLKRLFSRKGSPLFKSLLCGVFLPMTLPAVKPFGKEFARETKGTPEVLLYFLAAGSLSPVVFFSTLLAFGLSWKMALTRFILSIAILVVIGLLLKALSPQGKSPFKSLGPRVPERDPVYAQEWWLRAAPGASGTLRTALQAGANHFIASFRLFILAAIVISFIGSALPPNVLEILSPKLAYVILAMIGLSLVLSVPSPADAFAVVSLALLPGWAKLAFLAGPLVSLKMLHTYSSFLNRKALILILLTVVPLVLLFVMLVVWSGIIFPKGA